MNNLKSGLRGLFVPKEIVFDRNLTLAEKIMLSIMISYSKGNVCTLTNKQFSKFMDFEKRHAVRIISKLNKNGYVVSSFGDSNSRTLTIQKTYLTPEELTICWKRKVKHLK